MKTVSTKEKIIQKSSELFNTYGYHGCSLSHIMEATQLKKGGIYNHFRNKDEIAVEAFNYNYDRVLKRFRDRLAKAQSSYDKLISVIDVFVSFIDDPMVQGGGCPIFNTAMDATNTHPALKKKAREGIQGLKKYIEIKLQEGIDAGEFRSDIHINQVATLLIATLEGAIIMSRIDENKACVDYAAGYLKGYIKSNLLL
ncbi:MAG: TetR/AcrR family transcriptional regulator [Fulvivirga sp.]|nr:TetR/AcrR family transcriptional regulator [Fulvivirga sp.]